MWEWYDQVQLSGHLVRTHPTLPHLQVSQKCSLTAPPPRARAGPSSGARYRRRLGGFRARLGPQARDSQTGGEVALNFGATPTTANVALTVRFTPYHSHLLHDNERAVLYLPQQMQDEIERMFLLMAILHTEMHRQDLYWNRGSLLFLLIAAITIELSPRIDEPVEIRGCNRAIARTLLGLRELVLQMDGARLWGPHVRRRERQAKDNTASERQMERALDSLEAARFQEEEIRADCDIVECVERRRQLIRRERQFLSGVHGPGWLYHGSSERLQDRKHARYCKVAHEFVPRCFQPLNCLCFISPNVPRVGSNYGNGVVEKPCCIFGVEGRRHVQDEIGVMLGAVFKQGVPSTHVNQAHWFIKNYGGASAALVYLTFLGQNETAYTEAVQDAPSPDVRDPSKQKAIARNMRKVSGARQIIHHASAGWRSAKILEDRVTAMDTLSSMRPEQHFPEIGRQVFWDFLWATRPGFSNIGFAPIVHLDLAPRLQALLQRPPPPNPSLGIKGMIRAYPGRAMRAQKRIGRKSSRAPWIGAFQTTFGCLSRLRNSIWPEQSSSGQAQLAMVTISWDKLSSSIDNFRYVTYEKNREKKKMRKKTLGGSTVERARPRFSKATSLHQQSMIGARKGIRREEQSLRMGTARNGALGSLTAQPKGKKALSQITDGLGPNRTGAERHSQRRTIVADGDRPQRSPSGRPNNLSDAADFRCASAVEQFALRAPGERGRATPGSMPVSVDAKRNNGVVIGRS
ncbi:hypothetical protein C8R47DRAFT_1202155 [Mycena vitilis]|nr:hypothetical protein C8R47DRAFT_1202155 [Mycena vitilis]